MENSKSPTPSDIQKTEQNTPIKISYEDKINSELKNAEDSLRNMSQKMPLSISGIASIFSGFSGLFLHRFWFGILALGLAIVARKYQNDLAGFYLGLALAVVDILIFLIVWFLFHFTQAGLWA